MAKEKKHKVVPERTMDHYGVTNSRPEEILDKITKSFIFEDHPLRAKSRRKEGYTWTLNEIVFTSNMDFTKFILDFVLNEMPEVHETFTPEHIRDVGLGIQAMIDKYGHTLDGFETKNKSSNEHRLLNTARPVERLSVDDATEAVSRKYDVDLAIDGTFLVFTNRKTGESEPPVGGLGPIIKTTSILEKEYSYAQPECTLLAGVVSKLYQIAEKKKKKVNLYLGEDAFDVKRFDFFGVMDKFSVDEFVRNNIYKMEANLTVWPDDEEELCCIVNKESKNNEWRIL